LAFEVADTGPGIPPEQLKHVFERFHKGSRPSSAGVGLGLYIAKGIVEAHGGSIKAQNRFEGGCVVSFTLPIEISPMQGTPEYRAAPSVSS
jgi:signal transduction histidine kinase